MSNDGCVSGAAKEVSIEPFASRTALDNVGYRRRLAVEEPVDVKPGNENEIDPINLRAKGSLPLAVFSQHRTATPNLIQMATASFGHAEDLNGDGLLDVVCAPCADIRVRGGTISSDGKRVASASRDETAKIWDAETGRELLTFRSNSNFVRHIIFAPNARYVASAIKATLAGWPAARRKADRVGAAAQPERTNLGHGFSVRLARNSSGPA